MRKTKIVCTLGPACRDENTLTEMIKAGMNVARLNMSHQDYTFHTENIQTLKRLRERLGVPLAIMMDTKGPEIRTGILKEGSVFLKSGDRFILTANETVGDNKICSVSYKRLPVCLSPGDTVLIDDGRISLLVESIEGDNINCTVTSGGSLGNTRGINIPGKDIDMPFLSEKDKNDLLFAVEQGVDLIAASFVRSATDIAVMREFLSVHGGNDIKIFAKIENSSGIENFASILSISDGIMVARGDMGVEIAFERLPGIQKKLIHECVKSGKPAITATQMLESMIDSIAPTRAEISDVANAVFDSTSAVMLSGETAIGKDPARVVEVMASICEQAEKDMLSREDYGVPRGLEAEQNATDTVCDAAAHAADHISADALIAVTLNGDTARFMSKYRPRVKIIGATYNLRTYHQLAVNWGVIPMLTDPQDNTDSLFAHVAKRSVEWGLLKKGDTAIITSGAPVGVSGRTNLLKITPIEG